MIIMLLSLIIIYKKLEIGIDASSKREVFLVHINFTPLNKSILPKADSNDFQGYFFHYINRLIY